MYQRVEKPRIYASMGYYDYINGYQRQDMDFSNSALINYSGGSSSLAQYNMLRTIDMDPYNPTIFQTDGETDPFMMVFRSGIYSNLAEHFIINYFGILGHNFYDCNAMFKVDVSDGDEDGSWESIPCTSLLNNHIVFDGQNYWNIPMKNYTDPGNDDPWIDVIDNSNNYSNGTSMANLDGASITSDLGKFIRITIAPKPFDDQGGFAEPDGNIVGFTGNVEIGSFIWGKYYDLKSPDLNYTMGFEYDGINTFESKESGKRFVNKHFDRNPGFCYKYQPFGVQHHKPSTSYNGRRWFNLQFTALRDSYKDDYSNSDDPFVLPEYLTHSYHGFASNDFYTQVVKRTMGGAAPFIFEFNRAEAEEDSHIALTGEHVEDNFIFATFDNNNFSFDHSYHRMYSIGMKIRESW